jgi:hypothetical protein
MRMQLLQLVDIHVEEAPRPICEEVAALKLLLACIGDSLEPSEACTSGDLGLALTQASLPVDSIEHKSSVVEEEHLHGCYSQWKSLHVATTCLQERWHGWDLGSAY